jgi:DNA-binding YbaB/EbfC family protein
MKNFANMLKQAQELQGRMAEMQAQLENLTVEGSAGGDMVKVTLSGKGDLRQVHIDPSLAKDDDVEIIEDLIVAAHAEAKRRLEEALQERMKEITGGMPMPPGFGL